MFFFPSRSNNRPGLLIECSKLTCFAREKATWFDGEIDVGCCQAYLRGRERVRRGENRSRTTCPNSKHEEKKPLSTHEFESRRVRVRQPNSKLHRRNARCMHQHMQWSDTRSILLCMQYCHVIYWAVGRLFLLG